MQTGDRLITPYKLLLWLQTTYAEIYATKRAVVESTSLSRVGGFAGHLLCFPQLRNFEESNFHRSSTTPGPGRKKPISVPTVALPISNYRKNYSVICLIYSGISPTLISLSPLIYITQFNDQEI